MLNDFVMNFAHNLFKPLLLFFYAGFAIPLLNVKFEFPKVLYQGLTMYLLLAIGWHGGEELAGLEPAMYGQAAGFMLLGFCTNSIIGVAAYLGLRWFTGLRQVDAATVAGYYGSDSAGTFVTCMGVLTAAQISFAAYMPVMLAIMEIPGCLIALYLVSRLRRNGMDAKGNMPGETTYVGKRASANLQARQMRTEHLEPEESEAADFEDMIEQYNDEEGELVAAGAGSQEQYGSAGVGSYDSRRANQNGRGTKALYRGAGSYGGDHDGDGDDAERAKAVAAEAELALEPADGETHTKHGGINAELLHEVFLNPGIYLLFAGIAIGFVSRLQGAKVVAAGDSVFVTLFQGMLCLFLLEMGMTASRKLKDLKAAGWRFIAFGVIAPNVFAIFGMCMARLYSMLTVTPLEIGTYVLFAVLCGAASYIAVPAVQRLAIPEASPTLPLAASLGLTFSYNVTVGIPVYILVANLLA
jgi:hypothetical protein